MSISKNVYNINKYQVPKCGAWPRVMRARWPLAPRNIQDTGALIWPEIFAQISLSYITYNTSFIHLWYQCLSSFRHTYLSLYNIYRQARKIFSPD